MTEETTTGLNLKKEPSIFEQLYEIGSGKKYVPRPTWDQIMINHLEGRMHLAPLTDDMPKTLYGYASYFYEKNETKQENWDDKGNVFYTDEEGNKVESDTGLSIADKIIRRLRAVGKNTKDFIEESDSESDVYKQKINNLFNLETQLLSLSLLRHIKPIIPSREITYSTEDLVNNFFNRNNPKLEKMPPRYEGKRNIQSVIEHIGNNGYVKTPQRSVIFNENNLRHYLFENNPERLYDLNKTIGTFERPNFIIKGQRNENSYKYFVKPYLYNGNVYGHLGIARNKQIGDFYQTNFAMRSNKLRDLINNGQITYSNLPVSTAPVLNNTPVESIINYDNINFNPQSLNSDNKQTYPNNKFNMFIDFIKTIFQK